MAVDADPTVVLAYTKTEFIDGDGKAIDLEDPGWQLLSDDPADRLAYAIQAGHFVNAILGVIRTDALRRTHLEPAHRGGDYRLMAELALLGKFVEVPEYLYERRVHVGSSRATPRTRPGCASTSAAPEPACASGIGACQGSTPRSRSARRSRSHGRWPCLAWSPG